MTRPTYELTGKDLQNMPELLVNYRPNVQVAQTIGCLETRETIFKILIYS